MPLSFFYYFNVKQSRLLCNFKGEVLGGMAAPPPQKCIKKSTYLVIIWCSAAQLKPPWFMPNVAFSHLHFEGKIFSQWTFFLPKSFYYLDILTILIKWGKQMFLAEQQKREHFLHFMLMLKEKWPIYRETDLLFVLSTHLKPDKINDWNSIRIPVII